MKRILIDLWRDEQGQDLIEYTLLVSFVITVAIALIISYSSSIAGILFATTNNLNAARQAVN